MRALIIGLLLFLCGATPSIAQAPPQRLLSFEQPLRASKWWPLGGLQARLNTALEHCQSPVRLKVDYVLGRRTGDAIAELRKCAAYDIAGEAGRRDLTTALWLRLFPETPPPAAAARIHVLVLTFENTDYDEFLWNVGQPSDPTAWGTWGPFGATLAHGAEIQRVLDAVEQATPGLVARAFETAAAAPDDFGPQPGWRSAYCAGNPQTAPELSGAALLRSLAKPVSAADKTALRREFCGDAYRVWYRAFRTLGEQQPVREAFDAHYTAQNRRIVAGFSRLYTERALPRTETDWAFFLDRATQFSTDMALAGAGLDTLETAATPARRRLAISRAHRPKRDCPERANGLCVGWLTRVGRDMSYVVDALGEGVMTAEEATAWRGYGMRRASSLGLDDVIAVDAAPY